MQIKNIGVAEIEDGDYHGSFAYGGFEYKVLTLVRSGRIHDIRILSNRNTKHAKMAEAVIPRIIEFQSPDVDAVSGATTTSKALMKAVENSLTQ